MKVVYVAGKLTAPNNFELVHNVRAVEEVGMEVAKLGASPLMPHANTGVTFMGTLTAEFWYEATLELMRRCDAVVLVPGWESSTGTKKEVEEAKKINLPVFDSLLELSTWLVTGRPLGSSALKDQVFRDFSYVVTGERFERKFDIRRTLGDIAEEVLFDFHKNRTSHFPRTSDWEIRSEGGVLFDHHSLFGEVDLPGRIFYISPKAEHLR